MAVLDGITLEGWLVVRARAMEKEVQDLHHTRALPTCSRKRLISYFIALPFAPCFCLSLEAVALLQGERPH